MIEIEPERCFICKKLFCCTDCCVKHIKNKHPNSELKCPLCRYKPLTIRNFNNSEFLCHVVFHHLPLHCRTCGELFENAEDLKTIGICRQHPLITIEPPTFIDSIKSSLLINTPSPLNKTPSQLSSIDKKGISIIADYTNNFGNFTSPPEFTRNTSTPMHIGVMKKNTNLKYRIPTIPNIILTTPSFSVKNMGSDNDDDISGIVAFNNSSLNKKEFVYNNTQSSIKLNSLDKTPLKSILSMKSMSSESSQMSRHSKNYSDNKLASMAEVNEDEIDMELTDVNGGVLTEDTTPPVKNNNISMLQKLKDAGKKVRFSDECEINISNNKFDVSESEEFFDARQSFGDISIAAADNFDENNSSIKVCKDQNYQESKKETMDNNSGDNNNREKKENFETFINQQSKKSSRVVMMVLMEQTDDSNPTDLVSLIDSSLKKLGSVIQKTSIAQNNPEKCNEENTKALGKFSLVSVDSYPSVLTVEYFKAPDIEIISPKSQSTSNLNHGESGILSTVVNAVRNVFRNWAGVISAKNPTVVPTSSNNISQVPTTSVMSTSDKSLDIVVNSMENSSIRRAKRSRDELDLISVGTSEISNREEAELNRQNDIRSPLQKRPRGSYRQIHGREPIARMKNLVSTSRGISSEKQRFQQGSLTVGDTILPLPSRAHQSTQTD
ncbi:hypothetical protein PV327_008563 [Microctonus hyperodae]|uniref:Uncharacterized protein n=1 Tax=Microctonus hyperodae TaxID=165561 RepID=A0AA39F3D8_MICHY|nr:hypothetical protein PV327_008563 [Microctonus hyperodae]